MKIKKIERIKLDKPASVYDLKVEGDNHNFELALDNGKSIFVHNCDEINEKGVEEAISLLNALDNRFSSRFQGSDFVFQSVVSSARKTNSPIGEYVKRLPKEPSLIQFSPYLWAVKPDPNFVGDGTTFPVLVGNGTVPSRIITDPGELKMIEEGKFIEPPGCILINVPTPYRSKFELQLDQSIQDIAGMTTSDNNMVFRDTSLLEDASLLSEMYLEAGIRENVDLLHQLPLSQLFIRGADGVYRFRRAPNAPRVCHVDLAAGGDEHCDAALCIMHKEFVVNSLTGVHDTVYITDLLVSINAKTKIDILAIEKLLVGLVREYNANIVTVSSDQWNGEIFQQSLQASGCFTKVMKLSVDTKLEPYANGARLIEEGKVKVGTCPKLKKELEALILEKGKVTRTIEKKDECDVLIGCIYTLQLNYDDVPIYEYNQHLSRTPTDYGNMIDSDKEFLEDL